MSDDSKKYGTFGRKLVAVGLWTRDGWVSKSFVGGRVEPMSLAEACTLGTLDVVSSYPSAPMKEDRRG